MNFGKLTPRWDDLRIEKLPPRCCDDETVPVDKQYVCVWCSKVGPVEDFCEPRETVVTEHANGNVSVGSVALHDNGRPVTGLGNVQVGQVAGNIVGSVGQTGGVTAQTVTISGSPVRRAEQSARAAYRADGPKGFIEVLAKMDSEIYRDSMLYRGEVLRVGYGVEVYIGEWATPLSCCRPLTIRENDDYVGATGSIMNRWWVVPDGTIPENQFIMESRPTKPHHTVFSLKGVLIC